MTQGFAANAMAGGLEYHQAFEVIKILPGAGVYVIELGLPLADPMADGWTIQPAGQRALEAGTTLKKTLSTGCIPFSLD